MAKVTNAVEILPKIWTAWVGRTNVTDDRQTDGRQQIAIVNVSSRSLKSGDRWGAELICDGTCRRTGAFFRLKANSVKINLKRAVSVLALDVCTGTFWFRKKHWWRRRNFFDKSDIRNIARKGCKTQFIVDCYDHYHTRAEPRLVHVENSWPNRTQDMIPGQYNIIPGQYSASDMLLNKDDTVWTNVDIVRYRLHNKYIIFTLSVLLGQKTQQFKNLHYY